MKKILLSLMTVILLNAEQTLLLDISQISPAQLRFSLQNVEMKKNKKLKSGSTTCSESLPVVKAPFGYVLIDGHHDALSYLALGTRQILVRIVQDFSDLSEELFWSEVEKQGLAYPYTIQGERKIPPRNLSELTDDPNRYFAAISARKYPPDLKGSTGAHYPLWIKIGKDIPFIEFRISDALWESGLVYSYEMGDNPPEEFIERARGVLIQAQIPGLKIVPKKYHYKMFEKSLRQGLEIRTSKIGQFADRLGVFSRKSFKKGDVAIKWNLIELSREQLQSLSKYERENFCHTRNGVTLLYSDPERHVNRSKNPNVIPDFERKANIAIRDISPGEELAIPIDTVEDF
ncbi:MAG: hypothetical protein MRY21_06665 [Simkaniaceae bacterium]|nr:hypothetical protein [Simkaniaceae bacterium]